MIMDKIPEPNLLPLKMAVEMTTTHLHRALLIYSEQTQQVKTILEDRMSNLQTTLRQNLSPLQNLRLTIPPISLNLPPNLLRKNLY